MKILMITGKSASNMVKAVAEKFGCEVVVAPVDCVYFLTPDVVIDCVRRYKHRKFDLLIVPGLLKGDLAQIERDTGIRTFRGPADAANLEQLLENINSINLSKEFPAERQMKEHMRRAAEAELKKASSRNYIKKRIQKPGNLLIGGLPVGPDFPMRVLAEIVDAGSTDNEKLVEIGEYYKNSGADIVDLGFNDEDPDRVEEAISTLRKLKVPLSVDTMERKNIQCAIDLGIDMILSFDRSLLGEFRDVGTASVIIPDRKEIPAEPEKRIKMLEGNIALAEKRGFDKIIADPVLQPINFGFVNSILAYKMFRERSSYPMLFGAGNVTELFDADSTGVNALLCAIASDCRADIVFTPEHSEKAAGSVRELATGAKMMYLSKKRRSLPKNLGIDLL